MSEIYAYWSNGDALYLTCVIFTEIKAVNTLIDGSSVGPVSSQRMWYETVFKQCTAIVGLVGSAVLIQS